MPLTNAFAPKNAWVESNVTAAAFTTRASSRLVSPGTAFCSSSIVGTPRSAATMTTGPELYPPTPMTSDGRRADTIRQPSSRPSGTSSAPRSAIDDRLPLHAAAANQVQRKPLARHDPRLDARAVPANEITRVRPSRQQLARDGDSRIQMAARPAARDDHGAEASTVIPHADVDRAATR